MKSLPTQRSRITLDAKIVALKAERQPLYAQADFILQTDDLTPDQCTHQILLAFRERQQQAVAGGA